MEERSVRERVEALLDKATGLGAGSLRLAVLSATGERVVDGTAVRPDAALSTWLREALERHRSGDAVGRFRLRLLDAGGRAAGSVVIRSDDLPNGARSAVAAPKSPTTSAPPASAKAAGPVPAPRTDARLETADATPAEGRDRSPVLERRLQEAERRARDASASMASDLTRLRAEVRELEEAAARASTTAGDARRELAEARAALGQAKRDGRAALERAELAEARAADLARGTADQERSEGRARAAQEGEQKATARARHAEKRLDTLDAELSQVRAHEAALESAAAGLQEELSALRVENERLRAENQRLSGVVRRQHATIDTMEAQAEVINAQVHQLFDDEGAGRSKGRRG